MATVGVKGLMQLIEWNRQVAGARMTTNRHMDIVIK